MNRNGHTFKPIIRFPKQLRNIFLFCLMLFSAACVFAGTGEFKRNPLQRPPGDQEYYKIDGREYACGFMYLTDDRDTLLLKPYGFRRLSLMTRKEKEGVVCYNACWPTDLPWDSLPPQLRQLNYAKKVELHSGSIEDHWFSGTDKQDSAIGGGTPPQEAAMDTVDMARIDSLKKRHHLWVGPDTTSPIRLWRGEKRCYYGSMILSTTDTTGLNLDQYGVFIQVCSKWERDTTCHYCMAHWLVDLPWDSLPPQILGLHYAQP